MKIEISPEKEAKRPEEDFVIFFHEAGDEGKMLAFDILVKKEVVEKVKDKVLEFFGKDKDYKPRCDWAREFLKKTGAEDKFVLLYSGDFAHTPEYNAREVANLLFLVLELVVKKLINALEVFFAFEEEEGNLVVDEIESIYLRMAEIGEKLAEHEKWLKNLQKAINEILEKLEKMEAR